MIYIICLGVIVSLLAIYFLPKLQMMGFSALDDKFKKYELENEFRKTIIQVTGGFSLLVSLLFTWNQLAQTKDKDIAEQINKTIVLMGNDNEYVRIGAIYSIEQLSADYEGSKNIISNILSSYVRSSYSWNNNIISDRKNEVVQASLLVISKLIQSTPNIKIDISGTDLRRVELDGQKFNNCNFIGAHFEEADLLNTHFERSNLTGSSFNGASLVGTSFVGSNLNHASFAGVFFQNTDFSNSDLRGTTGISSDNIKNKEIIINDKTILPEKLK